MFFFRRKNRLQLECMLKILQLGSCDICQLSTFVVQYTIKIICKFGLYSTVASPQRHPYIIFNVTSHQVKKLKLQVTVRMNYYTTSVLFCIRPHKCDNWRRRFMSFHPFTHPLLTRLGDNETVVINCQV